MATRNAVILALVLGGGLAIVAGTPTPKKMLVVGACLYVLAYIYAELTRPKGPTR